MVTPKCQKVPIFFNCKSCDYRTSHKSHYVKHLTTDKHTCNTNVNITDNEQYSCGICGNKYKYPSGLSRHYSKCTNNVVNKDIVLQILKQNAEIIKENAELKNVMINVLNKCNHNTTTNHNKTFNLNFFLNDTCKDAMNLGDFVHNIQLQLSDLEKMGENGYVNGLTDIILKNLKDMAINIRPIHCMDIKREVIYVKDADKWDKEDNGNPKVRKAIKYIAHKNSKQLIEYKLMNPNYNNSSSKVSDTYNKLLIESMGGNGDNDLEKENKIIKNITREITVCK